ncbi:MAG: S8 family serine peptidase [Candidatus Zixiibacteriota bacterium]|nr:MAG: S8 family serine peptidase [candidate division Zixibacteria bacterium]
MAGIIKLTAPESHSYAYRVLDTAGTGGGYTIADAVFKAVEGSCRAINLSLGMIGVHNALDDATRFAKDNGIMVVAAASNDSSDNVFLFPFPASCHIVFPWPHRIQ